MNRIVFFFLGVIPFLLTAYRLPTATGETLPVRFDDQGQLVYEISKDGDRIPDFSCCGFGLGTADIPHVACAVHLEPAAGDDTFRIQSAIDHVASLPANANGYRGAICLAAGEFQVDGQIIIRQSGIVLRGAGALDGTTIAATGLDRRSLIRIVGEPNSQMTGEYVMADQRVSVGQTKLRLASSDGLQVGDRVLVRRPSTQPWIEAVRMDRIHHRWKPGTHDVVWDRMVTEVDGETIVLDAPVTTAMERKWGGGTIQRYLWPERRQRIGIEDLQLVSAVKDAKPKSEDHAWFGVWMDNVENAWVRRIRFRGFAGGAINIGRGARSTSVVDCISELPVSEIGGYRRHTFFTRGQLGLFLRCWSEEGRHDFSVGHCAAGPNAFVHCFAKNGLADSGPIESWANGVLYDNVRIDGGSLNLQRRELDQPGVGWSAANCVLWQCQADSIHCSQPPTAQNWTLGYWAQAFGSGVILGQSDFVQPLSLYQQQLRQRDASAAQRVGPLLLKPMGATNPSAEEAATFTEQSTRPAPTLRSLIESNMRSVTALQKGEKVAFRVVADQPKQPSRPSSPLEVCNGWLARAGRVLTGERFVPNWWRGNLRPTEASDRGAGITRFAPGLEGTGLTDHVNQVAEQLSKDGFVCYEHHYGLWYDRRRDDHLMVRRANGNVAPPFYEQPFARSGEGRAWDGLSRYDLTEYNPWYWRRLDSFATAAAERGLLLVHQHYFQHNILEAGAHWVDCPWRPANNVNAVQLPEPPTFIGDKRVFLAHQFYDISNAKYRELHKAYIKKCLDESTPHGNVLHLTSGEFTGPLSFIEFWLDTIAEWQREEQKQAHVVLSCTKDVQDAILADPVRSSLVDAIDIRYWMYTDHEVYAPRGGLHLAPRQHLRRQKPQASSFESTVRAIREYRNKFPSKPIIYNADLACRSPRNGWAILAGGGSLANVPQLPDKLLEQLVSMRPLATSSVAEDAWCLADGQGNYLIISNHGKTPWNLEFDGQPKPNWMRWIHAQSGKIEGAVPYQNPESRTRPKTKVLWLTKDVEK